MLHHQIAVGFIIFEVHVWYVSFCHFGVIWANFGRLVDSLGTTYGPIEVIFSFYYPQTVSPLLASSI